MRIDSVSWTVGIRFECSNPNPNPNSTYVERSRKSLSFVLCGVYIYFLNAEQEVSPIVLRDKRCVLYVVHSSKSCVHCIELALRIIQYPECTNDTDTTTVPYSIMLSIGHNV